MTTDQTIFESRRTMVLVFGAFVLLVVALAAALLSGWTADREQPVGVSVPAAPAREVQAEQPAPVEIATKTVEAYKPAIKRKLSLPKAVQDNPAALVVSAAKVAPDDHPHTITTTIDAGTGEVQTFDRRDPLPWIALTTRGRAGVYYGIKGGEPTIRLEAQQEVLQVKAAHIGVIGSIDQPVGGVRGTDYYAGVGVWMAW